jgi:electron transfer flavoprotein alpha subunit
MLRLARTSTLPSLARAYASAAPAGPHTLVLLEHRDGVLDGGSLAALTAAGSLGGPVSGLVLGGPDAVPPIVAAAQKCIHSSIS